MPARTRKTKLTETWRQRLRVAAMLNRLQDHAEGKCEMTATQVRAAEIILRKAVPDLSSIAHEGEVSHRYIAEIPAEAPSSEAWELAHKTH